MKISHSIFLSFVVILLSFAVTTYNDYRLTQGIKENAEYLSKSTEIVKYVSRFQRNILSIESGLRGYLLTGEPSFVKSYNSATIENEEILREFSQFPLDSSQLNLLKEIKLLNSRWTEDYTNPLLREKTRFLGSGQGPDSLNGFYKRFINSKESGVQSELEHRFSEFAALEYSLREKRKAKLAAKADEIQTISYSLTAVSILVGIIVTFLLIRRITHRIRQMSLLANRVAKGDYNVNISDLGNDELSFLGSSLNDMAKELSNNISLLKRSNSELDQFAHVVSHDMKSPLRGIANVVSWIEEDHSEELSPKMKEYLDLIKSRVVRGENLIAGLLAYARVDKDNFRKEMVDVNGIVEEIIDNTSGKRLGINFSSLPTINTERVLLLQVFSNLIDNAVKYNDKEKVEIFISFTESHDKYHFDIEDNGIGIAPNHYRRIFTIFETLKDKDSFESTGVGLAIVKKILDSLGQDIQVKSVPGKGSVFSFTWPK